MEPSKLPIRQYAEDIVNAVAKNDVVVVIGETGSGKTTQLSQVQQQAAAMSSHCGHPTTAAADRSCNATCRYYWSMDMPTKA
jgi:ATP-dependent RNA helicase DHX8/PRP22